VITGDLRKISNLYPLTLGIIGVFGRRFGWDMGGTGAGFRLQHIFLSFVPPGICQGNKIASDRCD